MKKGHIYKLTSPSNKQYIGQAVCILSNNKPYGYKKRWKGHINEAKNNRECCRILDNAIRKYGHENFKIELIEEIDIEKLDEREQFWISKLETLSPNGYNLTTGGGSRHRLSDESKLILGDKHRGKLKSRKYKEKLPLYVYYVKESNYEGYRIGGHPTLPSKRFTLNSQTMDQKLELVLNYLSNSEDVRKKQQILPEYIYVRNDGEYHGFIVKNHPILKNKSFTSKILSVEEKFQSALNYLKII